MRIGRALLAVCIAAGTTGGMCFAQEYEFKGGYPTPETVQKAYDDADLARAIQAYKFFYPTVSFEGTWRGNLKEGAVVNSVFPLLEGSPNQLVFTPNSDTPYAGLPLDLSKGPIVIDIPPGPIMGAANDLNQRWVSDLGLPGPDAGKGGKHLLVGPEYKGKIPNGYHVAKATTNRVLVLLRAIPPAGNNDAANALIQTVKVYPLNQTAGWKAPTWVKLPKGDFTPLQWETNFQYWQVLKEIIDLEPAYEAYRSYYGELAGLGIVKGQPFRPDERMKGILDKAAKIANAQMRVQSFADRRPDRVAWSDRKWEWATLRPENGTFDMPTYKDLDARAKWFYQAQVESPAMFRRSTGAGSLYWLGTRDAGGAYLDGGKNYKLSVPLPAPAKLFWSVTVYDAETRSEIATDQGHAALRSLFELKNVTGATADLYFGPNAPAGKESQWIKTAPGKGWFTYFRIYGPEAAAFNGSWKPGDFEEVK
ncbi:MAG TPA: DUF1254 domain-containing protein [Bradyrhizobium sp.]|nr:DUF1254 domain-containing protein [Bradyrhizobium sp.]